MIAGGEIAGVVLFAENVDGKAQVRRLVAELQGIERPKPLTMPLAVMVDQEGGLVERVPGPPSASAEEMGERGAGFARRQGAATARNLRGLGINVDLAPVLDVARSGGAIAGEDRSFGGSAAKVTRVGVGGFAAGLRSGGVAATAKHFPGLGAAAVNTDDAAQEITTPKRRLRSIDEAPFAAFVEEGGELVMLSHATYTAFSGQPATFSRAIVTGELRRRLGFDGVTITDSLDAAAALAFGSRASVAVAAAQAGNDLLLYGDWRTARRAGAALRRKLASGRLERDPFEASVERVLELRRELAD
jgi:beta-N-acetylhexosaminidase